jgi:hypothetical protein
MKKYHLWITEFREMVESSGLDYLLGKQTTEQFGYIGKFGEFVHEPFTEHLKSITAEWMTQIRNNDN